MLSNIFPYEFSDFCLQVRESNLKINHILQTKDPKNGHSLPGAFGPKKIKKTLNCLRFILYQTLSVKTSNIRSGSKGAPGWFN